MAEGIGVARGAAIDQRVLRARKERRLVQP